MKPSTLPPQAAPVLVDPYELFLARLSRKSLASVQAHLEACENSADLGLGRQWKRLAGMLAKMAGHAIEASGQHVLRFYIADGKYRQQVFTLEDARKGPIHVFLPDILDLAVSRKILTAPTDHERSYGVVGYPGFRIDIERISSESKEVPEFCRPMLGWGRRAIKIAIPAAGDDRLQDIILRLGELAAEAWPRESSLPPPARTPV